MRRRPLGCRWFKGRSGRVDYGSRPGAGPGCQHVAICRLPPSEVDPEFVLWGLRGVDGQAQLLGQRHRQGKPGVNLTNVRSLALPFPRLDEQKRIAEELNLLQAQANGLGQWQENFRRELNGLMPAILNQAFKGEL